VTGILNRNIEFAELIWAFFPIAPSYSPGGPLATEASVPRACRCCSILASAERWASGKPAMMSDEAQFLRGADR
jgi:hypothetical protein